MIIMKRILVVLFLLPALVFAQIKQKPKPVVKAKARVKVTNTPPLDGFIINGTITGYPEGTKIALLNGQSGMSESETTIQKNKFSFKGKITVPDFKIILFDNQPPYITLFLDNSAVRITGTKEKIDKAVVTGSRSHADYEAFNNLIEPYKNAFNDSAPFDSVAASKAVKIAVEFAEQHPNSFITPLAIIRYNQISDDPVKTETLFNTLSPEIKSTSMGAYLAQYLADAKKNAVGTLLPDFTQPDTSGKPISLSSLRGKYVLIDFWASWCGPCRQENPNVVEAFNKFKNKNFTILGVSLDKAKPAWEEAIRLDNLTWMHVSDLQGWSNAVAQQYQIYQIPQNILIDPEGKIVAKNLRGNQLDRKLMRVLK